MTDKGIDIGIIVRDSDAALAFYRDTLGLEHVADVRSLTGMMHRLQWGTSLVKLTRPDELPDAANPPGGLYTASGIRYLTLTVPDLDALVARTEAAGYPTAVPRKEVRPGVFIAIVEDPDGNWVEFLQAS
ncbi:VOC family protein [Acidiferrimicrobium sp. IK]|uniref:VOC family protein n=1 Tax=Acidiferrimicrobium sp. IK TaxID=2871700 RepID=UPI0021CB29C4|nr:VOC family protein [Acidiferrimicrobium sp. IK]MCU4182792.1 VOC family protein [Acidiferrimicrobium sp. IK]